MTTIEARERVRKILMDHPALTGDTDRHISVVRDVEKFSAVVMDQAYAEYRTLGERNFNVTQLLAIAYRIDRQAREREDSAARSRRQYEEQVTHAQMQQRLIEADRLIAEMTDEMVMEEGRQIILELQLAGADKAVEWAKERTAKAWRHNFSLRHRAAGMLQGNG
jgi:hypothetical protein